MPKTSWIDPTDGEVRSPYISGLQEAVGRLENALHQITASSTAIPMTLVPSVPGYRLYQAPVGKRNWLASPAPTVKVNGSTVSSGITVDHGGGAVVFTTPLTSGDEVTADATYISQTPVAAPRPARIVIAAADSTASERALADVVCTGTNDNATIQAAIESLPASPAGEVLFLTGTYVFSGPCSISNREYLTLRGCGPGTVFQGVAPAMNSESMFVFALGACSFPTIRDMRIITPGHGLLIGATIAAQVPHAVVKNVTITGGGPNTTALTIGDTGWYALIQDCTFSGNQDCIYTLGQFCVADGCVCDEYRGYAIWHQNAYGQVTRCVCKGSTSSPLGGNTAIWLAGYQSAVTDCYIDYSVNGPNAVVIAGEKSICARNIINNSHPISIEAPNVLCSENIVVIPLLEGIVLAGASDSIVSNNILSFYQTAGILVQGGSRCQIYGNCLRADTEGFSQPEYGIRIESGEAHRVFTNDLYQAGSTPFSDAGTNTNAGTIDAHGNRTA